MCKTIDITYQGCGCRLFVIDPGECDFDERNARCLYGLNHASSSLELDQQHKGDVIQTGYPCYRCAVDSPAKVAKALQSEPYDAVADMAIRAQINESLSQIEVIDKIYRKLGEEWHDIDIVYRWSATNADVQDVEEHIALLSGLGGLMQRTAFSQFHQTSFFQNLAGVANVLRRALKQLPRYDTTVHDLTTYQFLEAANSLKIAQEERVILVKLLQRIVYHYEGLERLQRQKFRNQMRRELGMGPEDSTSLETLQHALKLAWVSTVPEAIRLHETQGMTFDATWEYFVRGYADRPIDYADRPIDLEEGEILEDNTTTADADDNNDTRNLHRSRIDLGAAQTSPKP